MIYLLTAFSSTQQHIAQGANLVFFIPMSITAIIMNLKNKNVDKDVSYVVIISGIVGAIIGARISTKLDVQTLKKYFGYFLLIIAVVEICNLKKEYINCKKTDNKEK